MTEVARQNTRLTICVCRLKSTNGTGWSTCMTPTSGPDQPVCNGCEEAHHPQSEAFDPIIKPSGNATRVVDTSWGPQVVTVWSPS